MQNNSKNYSVLLIGTIGPILNQGKMLRWLNSQTQSDHISSFSMLLQWFVHSEPNNVDGMKDKWLCIAECLYESSLGRNYHLQINALLLLEWWSLCICLFFFYLANTIHFKVLVLHQAKDSSWEKVLLYIHTTLLEVFLLWTDIEGLCSTNRWWCLSDKCI